MKHRRIIVLSLSTLFMIFSILWIAGSILSSPVNKPIGDLPKDIIGKSVQFQSASGATIHGWLINGREGAGAIVLMHGVRASRLDMLERARFLFNAGYSVLLFDFQAHGESEGKHITFGYLESKDAEAAVSYIHTILPNEKIGVIGVSMGGAAVLLSTPELKVEAMVLEMVYPTIEQAISNRLIMRLGNWSRIFTPLLSLQLKRIGIDAKDLHPIEKVGKISFPKLFIAGAEDKHTTIEESKQLFNTASEPKELWIVKDAGHIDLQQFSKEEYEKRILLFFEKSIRE
jgi:uncharacterized protein